MTYWLKYYSRARKHWISSATPQACHGFADINQAHACLSASEQSSMIKLRYIVVEDQDAQPPSPL